MGLSVHDPFIDPLGNPLGLQRDNSKIINPTVIDVRASSELKLPKEFSFFRVTVVGSGGKGGNGNTGVGGGGGGGGFSRSPVLKISDFSSVSVARLANAFSATFGNWTLTATDGAAGAYPAVIAPGGVGSGGVENNSGGIGTSTQAGGGAGGPTSTGGGGGNPYTGDGGGGGAPAPNGSTGGGGGGGVGAAGGYTFYGSGNNTTRNGGAGKAIFGSRGGNGYLSAEGGAGAGGDWGGGGGGGSTYVNGSTGGPGGVRIELW